MMLRQILEICRHAAKHNPQDCCHFCYPFLGSEFLLPVLLPAKLDGGFLRFLGSFRQAHNLKVVGSNPTPATNTANTMHTAILTDGGFFVP